MCSSSMNQCLPSATLPPSLLNRKPKTQHKMINKKEKSKVSAVHHLCGQHVGEEAPPTGVGDCVGAVGGALGVGGDDRGGGGCSGGHRLDGGGHWVDGEGGRGRAGRRWLDHRHLSGLLALRVGGHTLAVHWFGGCPKGFTGVNERRCRTDAKTTMFLLGRSRVPDW